MSVVRGAFPTYHCESGIWTKLAAVLVFALVDDIFLAEESDGAHEGVVGHLGSWLGRVLKGVFREVEN